MTIKKSQEFTSSPYITTSVKPVDANVSHVVRFKSYPSCGVRLVALSTFDYLEELATNEIISVHQLYDGFTGRSGGAILAAANATGKFSAREARLPYVRTAYEEFGNDDPNITMFRNALHDVMNALPSAGMPDSGDVGQTEKFISSYFHEVWPYIKPRLSQQINDYLGEGWAGFAMKPVKAGSGYYAARVIQDIYNQHKDEIVATFKTGLSEYLAQEGNTPTYNHNILKTALRGAFGHQKVSETNKALFIAAYDYDAEQTVLMGGLGGSLWPEHDGSSPLKFMNGDEIIRDRTPVLQDVEIVDALMASTSIKGIIGEHVLPTTGRAMGDLAEYSLSTVMNIAADTQMRAVKYAQLNAATRKNWLLQTERISPAVVPRILMLGSGYHVLTSEGREQDGVIRSVAGFPHWSERAAATPAMAQLKWMYNTASAKEITGIDEALLYVDIPLTHGEDGISNDIKDGRPENLAALTRFGARQFKTHARSMYAHIKLHASVAVARGDISREQYLDACAVLERNFASEKSLNDMCEKAILSQEEILDIAVPKPVAKVETPIIAPKDNDLGRKAASVGGGAAGRISTENGHGHGFGHAMTQMLMRFSPHT